MGSKISLRLETFRWGGVIVCQIDSTMDTISAELGSMRICVKLESK